MSITLYLKVTVKVGQVKYLNACLHCNLRVNQMRATKLGPEVDLDQY